MQNGIAERFMRTLKDEHADFSDAKRPIADWLEVDHNTQRIHSALDYATPLEFEMASLNTSSLSV